MNEPQTAWRRDAPPDAAARDALAVQGLELRVVGTPAETEDWARADARGFLEPEPDRARLDAHVDGLGGRRLLGVYDGRGAQPRVPVGTFATWVAELTVPGGCMVPALAVSSVTVAPTHAGRGIARAMMEAELRTAAAAGVPVAALTASRATLYGRYGFAAAADVADWSVDVRHAGWAAPEPACRVDFVAPVQAVREAPAVHERVRRRRPGELQMPPRSWRLFAGLDAAVAKPREVRALHAVDAEGTVRGVAFYTVPHPFDEPLDATAHVRHLVADTDDAYAALWRQLLRLPLVATLRADLLSVDEPVRRMLADERAVTATVHDHHWVRVLDPAAALTARRYDMPGAVTLEVTDPLGLGGGRWTLRVDDGVAAVRPAAGGGDADGAIVRLGTAELSAAYLGGVRLATLAAAGRATGDGVGVASRLLASHTPPRLSFWY